MTNTDIAVVVRTAAGKTSTGQVQLQSWDSRERMRRALKFLGICWGLSIFSVLIPLAHFILVPGFFLGGILGTYIVWCQDRQITGGKTTCPGCGKEVELAKASDEWPLKDLCGHCQNSLYVDKA